MNIFYFYQFLIDSFNWNCGEKINQKNKKIHQNFRIHSIKNYTKCKSIQIKFKKLNLKLP